MGESELLKHLNQKQQDAVKHNEGPALVVAGPGSGKTRVLTHRAAYLVEQGLTSPEKIFCVTFTNKAAEEMKNRIKTLTKSQKNDFLWLGTFHSIASRILRKDGPEIGVPRNFVIYDTDDSKSLIKNILKELNLDPKKIKPEAVYETISSAKSELIEAEDYEKYARGLFQKTVARIYPIYQRMLRDNQALDFDDLLFNTVRLFKNAPHILEKYQNLFDYIMIDEYQDTNKAQYEISRLLSGKNKNLFVVGDMSQAIYSFRGADYRNILNFKRDYERAKIYPLEQNYRSTQTIIEAAKGLIKNNPSHVSLDLWTENEYGEKVKVYQAENEKDESAFVAQNIVKGKASGKSYRDFAVLYRTNAQSRNVEEAMIKNNIPYRIFGGFKFYSRKEIKDIIGYLRVINNPKDSVSWERIINTPPRGIGDKTREMMKQNGWNLEEIENKTKLPFDYWISHKSELSTRELMDDVIEKTSYIEWLNDGSEESLYRIENLKELRSVAEEFVHLEEFLENVSLIESSDKPERKNSEHKNDYVSIMTMHAAKGLEFDTVFITGLEEGLFPHSQSLDEISQLEEERRLCYVAVTRAMKNLYLTHADIRMYFGSIQANLPSRFMNELPSSVLETLKSGLRSSPRARNNSYGRFGQKNLNLNKKEIESFLDGLENDRRKFFS